MEVSIWTENSRASEKALAAYRKLKSAVNLVERHKMTENSTENDILHCALGLYNDIAKVLHCYNAIQNQIYAIGKLFTYVLTFKRLNKFIDELDPIQLEEQTDDIDTNEVVSLSTNQTQNCAAPFDEMIEDVIRRCSTANGSSRKRKKGLKAVKQTKTEKEKSDEGDTKLRMESTAITDRSGEDSSATIAAATACHEEEASTSRQQFILNKEADELGVARVFFNDEEEDNRTYRAA